MEILKPTFMALRDESLLSRCLAGMTQNPNEAFNQLVWKRCPKDVFVCKDVLDIATFSAILNYNDGTNGLLVIFEKLKISAGRFSHDGANNLDTSRVKNMDKKETVEVKKARKDNRAARKGYIDKERDKEGGDSYVSGNF
jgi:hypothetical protein